MNDLVPFLKQYALGTSLGRLALSARGAFERMRTSDEMLGCVANDRLATFLVTRLCRPQMTFADVGSHLGSVIAEVQVHCPTVTLVAFEAIPAKAEALQRKFPDVTINCCALAESAGRTRFFIDPASSGYSSLADNGGDEIEVEKARLSDLLYEADVVKIDVEGAELGVLRGADDLVQNSRPTIMLESGPEEVLDYTKALLYEWCDAHDYALFIPNRLAHTAPPLSLDNFIESHFYPRRTTNYFAVARERIQEIRERSFKLLHDI